MSDDNPSSANPFGRIADEFVEAFRQGQRPSVEEFARRYPDHAGEIREMLPALVLVEKARSAEDPGPRRPAQAPSAAASLQHLGDYQILREVGRGGMGVVYEAQQLSLGRHVAIKVLPSRALLDARQLGRFQREARSAAKLHHTNIVPVFGVGEQDGLHYYVMQFIQGLGLDAVLDELRRLRQPRGKQAPTRGDAPSRPTHATRDVSAVAVARVLLTGECRPSDPDGARTTPAGEPAAGADLGAPTPVRAADSSATIRLPGQTKASTLSDSGNQYWQSVARVGMQVADALAHAAGQGILHRDIKPSNLMLDDTGNVWVTDFGLAKAAGDGDDLTHTGDIVGTLRYMAPERFNGQGDVRSDVYSLGLTLYELLTLRPAFDEADRNRLVRQVMHDEPVRPRKLNPGVPRDLETVVLKAIARDPAHRYQTPAEMAEDLKRFLDYRPITARRTTELERLWMWARRRPAVAGLGAALFLCLLVGAITSTVFAIRASDSAREAREALGKADASATAAKQKAREADAARDTAQSQIVRLDLATARRHADLGEKDAALHWVVKAWRDDLARLRPGERLPAAAEANHRLRVANAVGRFTPLAGFCPHDRPVLDADCDPTGDRVVSLVGDSTARVWDAGRAALACPPLHHGGKVTSAEFSVKGDRIVTGSEDGTARLWDSATGKLLHTFRAGGPVARATLSPDGATLAAATGKVVLRWDVATGRPQGEPLPVGAEVIWVAYSPKGGRLVTQTAGEKGTARVWDAATGKALSDALPSPRYKEEPPGSETFVLNAFENHRWPTFSPDGRSLAVSDGFQVRIWSGGRVQAFRMHAEARPKQIEVCFAPKGPLVYFVMRPNHGVFHLNPATARLARLAGTPRFTTGLRLSPDGTLAAVPVSRGNTVLYRLPSGEVAGTLPASHDVTQFRFTRDGRRLMIASKDGVIRVWGLPGVGDALPRYQYDCGRADRFSSPTRQFSPDGKWEAVRTPEGVRLRRAGAGPGTLLPGTAASREFRFTATGAHLVMIREDGLEAWSVGGAGAVRAGSLTGRRVVQTAFSHDGRRVATLSQTRNHPPADGSVGDQVEVWELPGFRRLLGPVGQEVPRLDGVALNRDGTIVVAIRGGWASYPCWDVDTGGRLPDVRLRAGDGFQDFASRDDRLLMTMTSGEIYQWDVRAGRPGGPTIRYTASRALYSPDGTKILTGRDARLDLFDARTGEPLATLPGRFTNWWFSADGRRIVVQAGREALVWTLPELTAAAEHLPALARLLTGTKEDPDGGFVSLAEDEFLTHGESYRRAFRAWKGLPD